MLQSGLFSTRKAKLEYGRRKGEEKGGEERRRGGEERKGEAGHAAAASRPSEPHYPEKQQ